MSDHRRETPCRCPVGPRWLSSQLGTGQIPTGVFRTELLRCTGARTDKALSSVTQKPRCQQCLLPQTAAHVTVVIHQLPAPNMAGVPEPKSQRDVPAWRGGDSPTKAVLVRQPLHLRGAFGSESTALGLHQRQDPNTLLGTDSALPEAHRTLV